MRTIGPSIFIDMTLFLIRFFELLTDVTHPDSFFDKKLAQKLISAVETRCLASQCQKREARDAMPRVSMPETRGRRREHRVSTALILIHNLLIQKNNLKN